MKKYILFVFFAFELLALILGLDFATDFISAKDDTKVLIGYSLFVVLGTVVLANGCFFFRKISSWIDS